MDQQAQREILSERMVIWSLRIKKHGAEMSPSEWTTFLRDAVACAESFTGTPLQDVAARIEQVRRQRGVEIVANSFVPTKDNPMAIWTDNP